VFFFSLPPEGMREEKVRCVGDGAGGGIGRGGENRGGGVGRGSSGPEPRGGGAAAAVRRGGETGIGIFFLGFSRWDSSGVFSPLRKTWIL
jgi:hypothetical protein